eukprot:359729-Prymnesium_polylepis.1
MVWSVSPPRATRGATPAHRRKLHRRIRRAPRAASPRAAPCQPCQPALSGMCATPRSALHGAACRAP